MMTEKQIIVMSKDQRPQTPVSNRKKKPSAGDYILLGDKE
jgi:hypothetical protein